MFRLCLLVVFVGKSDLVDLSWVDGNICDLYIVIFSYLVFVYGLCKLGLVSFLSIEFGV